ncbi:lipopolysaccharide biosynthesis protein [Flavobacterium sp.]|uniref:lipopolysaccharide biosynthesis protein n=1 Tax=Flavobacterium sp. TaxID=239 RepID=UPI0028BDF43C|nr:lipopolysaccharide biosynthesis protein [Flavobacterium sp.]
MSLKKQTFSAIIWTFLDTVFTKGITLFASVVLARTLGPEDFGIIGMITIFIAIGTTLTDSGLASSLIRSQEADEKDYSTVFFTNVGISLVIYLILFLSAPFIAKFYNQEILVSVVRVYGLSFVVSALSAVQLAIHTKNMQFKKLMRYSLPANIIGVATGIFMANKGFGVWSIIGMYLTTQIINSILLWIFSDWKPHLYFSKAKLKKHFDFGNKLMLSSLLNTFFDNIYSVLIGKFFSVRQLGFYDRAKVFNNYPVTILTTIISKVTYPLLSNIQEEKERIARTYKQILQFTFFITAPLMIGLAAASEPLVELLLGKEWLTSAFFFKILCFSSMLYPIHAFNINILKVYGRSDLFLKLEIIKKVIIVLGVIVSFSFGIYALLWASVVTSFVALLINTYYSSDMIHYKTFHQLRDMLPTLVYALLSGITIAAVIHFLDDYSILLKLFLAALTGIIVYFVLNKLFSNPPYIYTEQLLKNRFSR